MPLGNHTDAWYEAQNKATGQPKGARHSDHWYQTHQQPYGVGPVAPPPPGTGGSGGPYYPGIVGTGPGGTGPNVPGGGNTTTPGTGNAGPGHEFFVPPTSPPVVTPTGPTAAELAAKEAKRQADMLARRKEWDRLNNQGIYDPDGWQSIGYQPDPVAMPSWWLDGLELGTTAPAVPLPIPPVIPPPVVPPVTPPAEEQRSAAPAAVPNALAQLFGQTGQALGEVGEAGRPAAHPSGSGGWTQPQAAAPAGQSAQGAWGGGQNPFSAQQPDAGAWGQQPAASGQPRTQSAFGAPNQNQGLQSWTQPRRQRRQPGVWGQQTQAGTWGTGSL